jgi:hypothetical protein
VCSDNAAYLSAAGRQGALRRYWHGFVGWAKARSAMPTRRSANPNVPIEMSSDSECHSSRTVRGETVWTNRCAQLAAARGHGATRPCPPYSTPPRARNPQADSPHSLTTSAMSSRVSAQPAARTSRLRAMVSRHECRAAANRMPQPRNVQSAGRAIADHQDL